MSKPRRNPARSKMVSGPEDGPGQVVIMDGVTCVADAEGVLRDANGRPPPERPAGPASPWSTTSADSVAVPRAPMVPTLTK